MYKQRRVFCLGLSTALLTASRPAAADGRPRLRVLAWPGYAEPEIIKSFEQRTGAQIELTLIDSDLDLWQKMNARQGANFDVFAVNTAELQRYVQQGLVANLEPGLIPNLARQLPRFRKPGAIPGIGAGKELSKNGVRFI